jgi:hypothetical protein
LIIVHKYGIINTNDGSVFPKSEKCLKRNLNNISKKHSNNGKGLNMKKAADKHYLNIIRSLDAYKRYGKRKLLQDMHRPMVIPDKKKEQNRRKCRIPIKYTID